MRRTPRGGPIRVLFTSAFLAAAFSFYPQTIQAAPQGAVVWTSNAASGSKIEATEIQEIRDRIDDARNACGQLDYNWVNPPSPVASGTRMRADTINEIITVLSSPPFAANALIPGNVAAGSRIQASTILALKAALDATTCAVVGLCPNGVVNPGETCDDNNSANGDGCSSACQCECTAWADDACGPSGGCLPTDMHQTRNCPVPIAQCAADQCLAGGCSGSCDNDSVCDAGENDVNCPSDCCLPVCGTNDVNGCLQSCAACPINTVDGGSVTAYVSGNCSNPVSAAVCCPACNNDNICDAGEDSGNCPNDCCSPLCGSTQGACMISCAACPAWATDSSSIAAYVPGFCSAGTVSGLLCCPGPCIPSSAVFVGTAPVRCVGENAVYEDYFACVGTCPGGPTECCGAPSGSDCNYSGPSGDGSQCQSNRCEVDHVQCPTCSDNILNQGETGVDCGGPCAVCPGCGNNICEAGEDPDSCIPDCCGSSGRAVCGGGSICCNPGEICCAVMGDLCIDPGSCLGPYCGDGNVDPGEQCEPPGTPTCDALCQDIVPVCGNTTCDPGETLSNCCEDCGSTCGDSVCCPGAGEDTSSCCDDCGATPGNCLVCVNNTQVDPCQAFWDAGCPSQPPSSCDAIGPINGCFARNCCCYNINSDTCDPC